MAILFDGPPAAAGVTGEPWMSAGERARFKMLVEAGAITRFRVDRCFRVGCDQTVPRGKLFCCVECFSAECADEEEKS